MKILFAIFIYTGLFISLTNAQIQNLNQKEKVVYELQKTNEYSDIIVFTSLNDSLRVGTYFGVEFLQNNKPVYFKSEFVSKKMGNYDLVFELKYFEFSDESLYHKPKMKNPNIASSQIPFILQHPINFLGEFVDESLKLNRITIEHAFSSSDRMIFQKKSIIQ